MSGKMCGNPVSLFCLGGRQYEEQAFDGRQRASNCVYSCALTDVGVATALLPGNLGWLPLE